MSEVLIGVVSPRICMALRFLMNFPLMRRRSSATFCRQL